MAENSQSRSMVNDLTEGNVILLLVRFAFPLFISNALQAFYNIVDMIVVGQVLGGTGMSAVATGGEILHIIVFMAMGFSSAGQVIIAKDVGGGRLDEVKKTIGTMFSFLIPAAIVISVICYFLRNNIVSWMNTPAEAVSYTLDYVVTCVVGLAFIYGYNIVSAILRGMGDSKRPFVFIAIAAVLNIVLDIVFVAFLGLEVFGAALATVIGQGVSFIISIIYLYRRRESFCFDFAPSSFKISGPALKKLVSLGIPMSIQYAAISFSKIVVTAWINAYGVVYSALAGVYSKVNTMASIVANSFTTAGSSMVGQNLGAGKYKRIPVILRTVLVIGTVIAIFLSAAVVFGSNTVFSWFTEDADVLAEASILIIPLVISFFGMATRTMAFSIINGSGNNRLNLIVALLDGLISRISLAAIFGFALSLGCKGFWYGDAIAGFMPFVIGFSYYLTGKWKKC